VINLCAIASGSNGNCYYIGNHHEAVLIDAGISARQIVGRMLQQGIDPAKLKAVFISHEHADHTSGARVLSKRLNIPVFVTSRTFMAMYNYHRPMAPRFFEPDTEIRVGSFLIYPFLKNHDAAEPCSFRVMHDELSIGVFTDIGSPCERLRHHLQQCQALFLETNYDEKMLWEGRYPWPLKKRIASEVGHLSNDQAYELINSLSGSRLQLVFLSHLSAENNTPEKAMARFEGLQDRMKIRLTSRYHAGEVIQILPG
jgi:phosphoribosyl 1,2-cyclic phosphodiesterase